MKLLRNAGLYIVHLAVAVFGGMIVASSVGRTIGLLIHQPSVAGASARAMSLSFVCGAVLGALIYWQWKWRAAIWVWILPSLLFALISILARRLPGGWWYWISGLACGHGERTGCFDFAFTTLFLQAAGYSVGTLITSWFIPSRRIATS